MNGNGLGIQESRDNLQFDSKDLRLLAEEYSTPLFVFSQRRIRSNARRILEGLRSVHQDSRVFYACKANSNLSVLKTIRDAGLNLEVNSGGELYKGLKAGFRPDQILFNGVGKTSDELRQAISERIHCINVDSESELRTLVKIAKDLCTPTPISLRMVPEIRDGGHEGLETGISKSKFGIHPGQIERILEIIKQNRRWLRLIGLHAHVGSQLGSIESYRHSLERLSQLKARVEDQLAIRIGHLNLGGGLPVDYFRTGVLEKNGCNGPSESFKSPFGPEDLSRLLKDLMVHSHNRLPLYMEPGRSVVADAGILLTRVVRKKATSPDSAPWLILDAGFNILLESLSYQWYFHLVSVERAGSPHDTGYFVGGPLCDGGDIFPIPGSGCSKYHRLLPKGIKEGELLAFLDTGAYTLEQMMPYNGRLCAMAVMIQMDGKIKVIRRRDTYEDLVDRDL